MATYQQPRKFHDKYANARRENEKKNHCYLLCFVSCENILLQNILRPEPIIITIIHLCEEFHQRRRLGLLVPQLRKLVPSAAVCSTGGARHNRRRRRRGRGRGEKRVQGRPERRHLGVGADHVIELLEPMRRRTRRVCPRWRRRLGAKVETVGERVTAAQEGARRWQWRGGWECVGP